MPSAATWIACAHDLDAAEGQAEELAGELVVVAGHEDHARAAPHLAQQLLHDVVVRLRPVPARAQPPAVDDVADEIDRVRLVVAKQVEDEIRLAAARAEMEIRQEQRAIAMGRRGCLDTPASRIRVSSCERLCADSRVASMTRWRWPRYKSATLTCRAKERNDGSGDRGPQGDRLRLEQGLGRACALALAEAGCEVVRQRPRRGDACADDGRDIRDGDAASTVREVAGDLDDPATRAALLAACPSADILVNNNGGPPFKAFAAIDARGHSRGRRSRTC